MSDWLLDQTYLFEGRTVRYAVMGEGPPVVLVHGTPFSSYVWHRIAPYLAERRRVYLFDLLGYGQSDKHPEQDVSLGVQNELLTELLDHWGLDSPEVVGHDFGGTTVLRAHLINGRDFRNITLIDPVALPPWSSGIDRVIRGHEHIFGALPSELHEAMLNSYIREAIYRPISDDELRPYLEPWLGDPGQTAFYRQMAQFDQRFTDEIQQRYRDVRAPTLIIWGEQDRWLPIAQGRELATLIPDASFRPVAGSGHLVQEDAPEAIIAALMATPSPHTSRPETVASSK
jgi:pimeloyl-ACP methyl ester carboxylesterase